MTELYIDGNPVVLPDDFSNRIIEENPFLTKNGKYTFDVDLSLENPVNARIYKHYGRINNNMQLFTNRSAVLIIDNKIHLNGVEIVLSVSSKTASIQLASGNSELNNLIQSEKNIRDLDMGSVFFAEEETTSADGIYQLPDTWLQPDIISYLSLGYPDKNFVLAPFYSNDHERIYNNYVYWRKSTDTGTTTPLFTNGKKPRPQPYFAAIIQKLISAIGYELTENFIADHSVFCNYYLLHGYYTMEYAKMLPSWSVSDFLSKIEKQFNCTFLVDEKRKEVRLLANSDLADGDPNFIDVFDEHELEIDSEIQTELSQANLEYNLEENEIYKYNKIDKNIYDFALKATYTSLTGLTIAVDADDDRLKKIYQGPYGSFMVIPDGESYKLKRINQYKNYYKTDKEDIDESFDIIPAPMKPVVDSVKKYVNDNYIWDVAPGTPMLITEEKHFYNQYPVVFETEKEEATVEDEYTLDEAINGAYQAEETTTSLKMITAIYDGLKALDYVDGAPSFAVTNFPTPYVAALADYFDGKMAPRYFAAIDMFDLEFMSDQIYEPSRIYKTKLFSFKFLSKYNLDITRPVIANNRKFVCLKYEKSFNKFGFSKEAEGYFYPIDE